ncbi:ejaculatory bulb-specific protein 3-like isoform X1 [Coccinella septempunctata]|uniref:ejaculatory bulb-specific protein 3-like isoform X1 n=1 Tax=Coccinella septempunctata TaxID=41139 RepID=UPI001D0962DA|nr:ejaculatory bulb-specific protein 3-like isoform X1 [Coccinella septempunctata]
MKMHSITFVLVVTCAVLVTCEEEQYDSKFDNIDLDEIFKSERLIKNYHECFMERGNCTPQGAAIKKNLPDALKTECLRCTKKQKENAKKTLNFMLEEKPDLYTELEAKYDPAQVYRKKKAELGKF